MQCQRNIHLDKQSYVLTFSLGLFLGPVGPHQQAQRKVHTTASMIAHIDFPNASISPASNLVIWNFESEYSLIF